MRVPILACCAILVFLGDITRGQQQSPKEDPANLEFEDFKQLTFVRSISDHAVFAVNCEYEPRWTGDFRVVHREGGKIDWIAKIPREYSGGYVRSLSWIRFEDLGFDALEVITSTHKGNGSLWLFQLEGRELRTLMNTPVVGWANTPTPLKGLPVGHPVFAKQLSVDYQQSRSGDNREAVRLSGTVLITHPDMDDTIVARKEITEIWLWNDTDRTFHLQPSKR